MATGTAAQTVVQETRAPGGVVVNPDAFFARTEGRIRTPFTDALPGSGNTTQERTLPRSGVLAKLRVSFIGTITVTLGGGTVTTGPRWPHGIIDEYRLAADQRTDVFRVNGQDLHVLKACRHRGALEASIDVVPGGIGAGNALADGANPVVLHWEIPVNLDDDLNIGALFSQSQSVSITQLLRQFITSDLLTAAGGATIDSVVGEFSTSVESFTLPIVGGASQNGQGGSAQLVGPDISVYHAVIAKEVVYTAAGSVIVPITRGVGQLDRVLVSVSDGTDRAITTDPYLGVSDPTNGIESVIVQYGAGNRPRVWDPAFFLAARNLDDYGQVLPYGYLAIDNLSQNPPRDVINMPGVTDLEVVVNVGGGVAPGPGARVRVVAEMLLQGQGQS